MANQRNSTRRSSTRAALSGLAGGALGILAMDATMKRTRKLLRLDTHPSRRELGRSEAPRGSGPGSPPDGPGSWALLGVHHREGEGATEALGRIGYTAVTGREPDDDTQRQLGTAVHWGYGLAVGGLFGLLRGHRRWLLVDAVAGVSYGVGLWVFGDNLAVPLLGLADKPTRFGPRMHAHTLAGHLVYGLTTAAGTRLAGRVLGL